MRVAIYARYSSDNQREASIEDQVRQCRAHIDREGWNIAEIYSDAALSGATTLRPGYQKLLEDARNGASEAVVAESLDRLSRDQEDTAALYKQLSFADVTLVTLSEGEINELHVGLKGTMNALYLKDLAQKTRRGLRGRVLQGRIAGGNSYGYDVVREVNANGEPIRGGRTINEPQAEVISRIYREFAAGKSARAIAHGLNADGIPGPRKKLWSDTSIRGHRAARSGILRNELYNGRIVWNCQRYVTDPLTGKKRVRQNPESEWTIQEVPQLRIIDETLWNAVQTRLEEFRVSEGAQERKEGGNRFWEHRRPKHLLTGLAYCGTCGGKLMNLGRDYLGCGTARRSGSCDNRRSIRRTTLEDLVLGGLKENLMAPDLVKAFVSEFHKEVNRLNREKDAANELKRKELAGISKKYDGLVDAIADGLRTAGLKARLEELEARKTSLEEELAGLPPPAPRLHSNLAKLYRRKVENLHEALGQPETRMEAVEAIRPLIERITLNRTQEGFDIELVGEIANMLAISTGSDPNTLVQYNCSTKGIVGPYTELAIMSGAAPLLQGGRVLYRVECIGAEESRPGPMIANHQGTKTPRKNFFSLLGAFVPLWFTPSSSGAVGGVARGWMKFRTACMRRPIQKMRCRTPFLALFRPRRPSSRPGEVLGVWIHARAFNRTCSRIELPRRDILAGPVGVGFPLSGFLPRFRLRPLAGLSLGHVLFALLPRESEEFYAWWMAESIDPERPGWGRFAKSAPGPGKSAPRMGPDLGFAVEVRCGPEAGGNNSMARRL